jgi:hypothetical protein
MELLIYPVVFYLYKRWQEPQLFLAADARG